MIGLNDIVITPIYLFAILLSAYFLKPYVTTSLTRKYFLSALLIKLFGAIMLGIIYQFYYSWGDTFNYWHHGSRWIYEAFWDNPIIGLRIIFSDPYAPDLYEYTSNIWLLRSSSGMFIVRLAGFFDLLTFHTYTATALFFGLIGFSGSWAAFAVLVKKFPNAHIQLAIFLLYMPSLVLWGSGVMKDTLAISAVCWIIWSLVQIIEFRRRRLKEIVILSIATLVLLQVKVYIMISLIAPLFFWIFLKWSKKVKGVVQKLLFLPLILMILLSPAIYLSLRVMTIDDKYSIDNLAERSRITAYDIRYWTGGNAGSGYSLGEHDGTWQGMLRMAPQGIIVSIFRPFIWEVRSPLMLLSAIESLFITILILRVLKRKKLKLLSKEPIVVASLIFIGSFAFAIGVSTFNFGTLARYRIPIMPFLGIVLGYISNLRKNENFTTNKKSIS